jgi:hypothetical protein
LVIELKTRSQSSEDYSALEEFLRTTQEEAETFLDILQEVIQDKNIGLNHDDELARRIVSGKPDVINTPKKFEQHVSGFIRIICGWHRDDYVWHIEPAAIRRSWKYSLERIIFIIAKIMNENLPDVEAKIWPPQTDWELKTVTFKAIGLANEWSFHPSDVDKINKKLFETLNTLV